MPLTSRPFEDTLTKSCPIGRPNGLLGEEDGDLSTGKERPKAALLLGNDRPNGTLSLEDVCRNGALSLRKDSSNGGTLSLENDRPNGTLSWGNDCSNGTFSLGNECLDGTLSLGKDRSNGTLSLWNDCQNGVLSMGKVFSSWKGGVLTLGEDVPTTRRPNSEPLDYGVRYLDSDQPNPGERRHCYRKSWVDHQHHSHPSSPGTICS